MEIAKQFSKDLTQPSTSSHLNHTVLVSNRSYFKDQHQSDQNLLNRYWSWQLLMHLHKTNKCLPIVSLSNSYSTRFPSITMHLFRKVTLLFFLIVLQNIHSVNRKQSVNYRKLFYFLNFYFTIKSSVLEFNKNCRQRSFFVFTQVTVKLN